MAPAWREREDRVNNEVRAGNAPLFIAARALNVTVTQAALGRGLANIASPDASRRSPILAFDGSRRTVDLSKVEALALDASALMTLALLGLVPKVLDAFPKVVIGTGTLSLLFEERERIRFHQPSRIAKAKRLKALIDKGAITIMEAPSDLPRSLVEEVGRDLAGMLVKAREVQGLVVQPGPLHKVGSFLEVEADLGDHASEITDTRQVLAFLKGQAALTANVDRDATAYIHRADRGMAGAKTVTATTPLFLDELAVSYLEHTDTLEPLTRVTGSVGVSKRTAEEVEALLAHEAQAEEMLARVEDLRAALEGGIRKGNVIINERTPSGEEEANELRRSPTIALLQSATPYDAIVVDDKALIRSTPQPVRARLLADQPFAEEMGVGVTTTMQLGPAISITADRFVDAIKAALGGATTVEATPESGEPIRFEATLTGTTLTLASKDLTIDHPFVTVFSPEQEARLQAAQAFSADVLVASERAEHWRRILTDRALTPLEYTDLLRDARATPEALLERLRDSRHLNPESMVPTEPGYWSSLLPMAAPDQDFAAFINGPLHTHHRDMLELNPQLALCRIGHTSAARAVIPFELLQKVNPQDLETTLANEDLLSLLFAFEVAANRLQDGAEWESIGTRALDKLFGDKEATNRRCELLSAAIVISFARLRRVTAWRAAPLYWRRLAALTHASVLADTLGVMPKPAPFRQWAFKNLGADFYWQTLTDRREGPSWWPQMMEPHALKAWTAARFLRAMETIDESRWPTAWRAAAEGIRGDTLDDRERAMMAFPAPLNDFTGYERTLDANLFGRTIEALREKPCRIPGLDPFIYPAKLTDEHLALLRDFVARTSLPAGEDAGVYVTELTVIAHAAGTCRDVALANALAEKAMVLFKPVTEDQREMVISLLVDAASAYPDEDAHLTWLAQWLERLAYTSSSNSEIDLLRSVVQSLIAVNPRYRPYLARVRAVLEIKSEQATATAG